MRRRTLTIALAVLLAAPAGADAASLKLRSAIAPPGASVAAEGAGWRPGSGVTIRRRGGAVLGRALVGPDGSFAATLKVPRGLRARTHPVQARGGRVAVDGTLRVVPATRDWAPREIALSSGQRAVISRTVAFPGAPVRIDAFGLGRGHVVSAQLRDGPPVVGRADARGRATLRLTVPLTRVEVSTLRLRLGRVRRVEPFYVLPPSTIAPPLPGPVRPVPLLAAAGDIACYPGEPVTATRCHHQATSDLLVSAQPDVVAELGDFQYDDGTTEELVEYDRTWGRTKARTRPAVGNHEYNSQFAAPYFAYFGAAAGAPDRGYYSYDIGAWHVVVLNSNCGQVACFRDSNQERWLRADLAAHPDRCTLAYFHHPRHSSAQQTRENTSVQPFWQALVDAQADLVLVGHVHHYERIAPLNAEGLVDRRRGLRQIVVGTGGRNYQQTQNRKPYSEAFNTDTFGVLFVSLGPDSYSWTFQPEVGDDFIDTGSDICR
jgi:acid phosphatase type 7